MEPVAEGVEEAPIAYDFADEVDVEEALLADLLFREESRSRRTTSSIRIRLPIISGNRKTHWTGRDAAPAARSVDM